MPATLYEKIWDAHCIEQSADGTALLYIDRHLIHEVTSPQAFAALKQEGRKVRAPQRCLAVADHNVPTTDRKSGIADPESRLQVEQLAANCATHKIPYLPMEDKRQGIVHVAGPEQGFSLPGTTLVCGDSHTSTHGAFGALAWGIGTSEVEHVLATQTLRQKKALPMRVNFSGSLPQGVGAKDMALALIGKISASGGQGHVIEYAGSAVRALSPAARMSLCNMSIEAGARAGLIAPDEVIFDYLNGRPLAPQGHDWDDALNYWRTLKSDEEAHFAREVELDVAKLAPLISWGTSPHHVAPVDGVVPDPNKVEDAARRAAMERALDYMGLRAGTKMTEIRPDCVFIGSCTNGRIEDLRAAAKMAAKGKVASHIRAMVVPGSGLVKEQAEAEGLDKIFIKAGFSWREPGCSMCLAMNADRLEPGERCASTSNRNFEGRQGRGGRTHLVSPAMAAAAAIAGHFVDIRQWGGLSS